LKAEIARNRPNLFHADYATRRLSGGNRAADNSHLTKHVVTFGFFAKDAGSIPAASTIIVKDLRKTTSKM